MDPYTIRTFTPADISAVVDLQQDYARQYPGKQALPGELYLSPGFHGGQDVFCAFQGDQMVAYAPVYLQAVQDGPAELPHRVWTDIMARPGLQGVEALKDRLLGLIERYALALTEPFPGRQVRLLFEVPVRETPAAEYVQSRGFAYFESVFSMLRDLNEPIPVLAVPQGFTLRRWKMESEAEQRAYIEARNACFPEAPTALADWQYFMQSPMWAVGTTIAAFEGDRLAGNVAVYWVDAEEEGRPGSTEDIFVCSEYRGKGLARAMIAEGMRYLQEHGRDQARLAVRALNENALGLYLDLGYRVVSESRFYGKDLR